MRAGATFRTVTGTTRLSSSQTWVIPTFSPTMALVAMAIPLCPGAGEPAPSFLIRVSANLDHANAPLGWAGGAPASVVPAGPHPLDSRGAGASGRRRVEPRDPGSPQVHGEEMLSAEQAHAKRAPEVSPGLSGRRCRGRGGGPPPGPA